MENPPPLRTFTCPTCGAPLEVNIDQPSIHCQYCNANIDNPEYHPPELQKPPVVLRTEKEYLVIPPTPHKRSAVGWIVFFSIFVVLLGGGIFLISTLSSGTGIQLFPLQVYTPVLLLDSSSTSPNLIAFTHDLGKDLNSLTRLDIVNHKVIWSTLSQSDYPYIDSMMAGDTLVYLTMGDRLIALQLSDGQKAWEATLPDKIASSLCSTCLQLQKGQVIVYTMDSSLTAFDALTGHQTWDKKFDRAGYILYPLDNTVGLLYSVDNGSAFGIFDPLTGDEVTQMVPSCLPAEGFGDEIGNYSQVVLDLNSQPQKVYFLFGFFNACIQGWDLSSGTMDWEYIEQDGNLDNSADNPPLLAGDTLFYNQDHQLCSIDTATGTQSQVLEDNEDYNLVPLLVSGQRLVVRAVRTRGTTRSELWGYDLSNGQNLWKRPLLDSSPVDPPQEMSGFIDEDQTAWTYQLTTSGLWLLTFQTQPNQLNLASVNLDTGELGSQSSLDLEMGSSTDFYSSPERISNQDDQLWFALELRIYAIDPQTGTFSFLW